MSGARWTPEEEQRLRELYPTTTTREVAAALGRSENAVGQRATKLGVRKVEGFRWEMPKKFWTEERAEWFKGYVPGHSWREISAEHERIFGTPLTKPQVQNAKHAMGVYSGTVGGQFEKGHEPFNKGRKQADYMSQEAIDRTKATRFKKGEVRDRPDGWLKPIGYERVDKDGYIWVKVRSSRISGPQRKESGHWNENWMPKNRHIWEQTHGEPVPPGHLVVFADHDRTNYDPANLVAVPRSLWRIIVRLGLEYHDADSLQACMLMAQIAHVRRAKEKEARQCRAGAR